MGKRGRRNHQKRISKPKAVPLTDKKENIWMTKAKPGPHAADYAIPLSVLLKDVLHVAKTTKESKIILNNRLVAVDSVVRTEPKFPVGFMDVVSLSKAEKHYRMVIDWKGRLTPVEISAEDAGSKILRVMGKHIAPGAKINLTLHDGRNMHGDNHLKLGDSIVVTLPKATMSAHLKLEPGARCLIREGKHAGKLVSLNEIIPRAAGKPAEAKVKSEEGEFVTVAKYLFVVDEKFEVSKDE
jgi:small subunit ribosomal protein S4e